MAKEPRKHYCTLSYMADYNLESPHIRESWWMKLAHVISNFSTISTKHPQTREVFRSTKKIVQEKRRHLNSQNSFVIHPFSMLHHYWRLIMAVVYPIVLWFDTLHIAIALKNPVPWMVGFKSAALFFNSICILDIIINFRSGYVKKYAKPLIFFASGVQKSTEKRVVLCPKEIAIHYLKTFLVIDSLTIPTCVYIVLYYTIRQQNMVWCIFNLIRFLRIARLYSSYQCAALLLSNPKICKDYHGFLAFVCVTAFILGAHIFGFIYITVPDTLAFYNGKFMDKFADVLKINFQRWQGYKPSNREVFMRSVLQSYEILIGKITVFDLYFGLDFPRACIIFFNIWAGLILRGFCFYTVFLLLSSNFQSRVKYDIFMKEVNHLLTHRNLNKKAQYQFNKYFQNTLKAEMFKEVEILSNMQPRTRFEIFAWSSMDLIRKCHLFSKLPNSLLSSLAFRLKYETYTPGLYVVRIGEVANCMYFIATGTVSIYNAWNQELCHLCDGDYFGEIGLINLTSSKRIADVITIENTELYRLDIKDFREVITPNSTIYQRMRNRSLHRTSVRRKSVYNTIYPRGSLFG